MLSRSLLNLIAVSLNYTFIAAWLLRTPNVVTLQSLIILKNPGQLIKLYSIILKFCKIKSYLDRRDQKMPF